MSKFPPNYNKKSGAIPPKMGKREASTSQLPTILIKRSANFFQMCNLTSMEIPLRSYKRSGSPPSARRFLGEAASLRLSSMF